MLAAFPFMQPDYTKKTLSISQPRAVHLVLGRLPLKNYTMPRGYKHCLFSKFQFILLTKHAKGQ